ncbi:MAG: hypothetical protein AAGA37_19980 [Actinomycetota bacterium]
MSDVSQGDGWWQASDGKWYAPEQHPDYKPAPPPPPPTNAPPPPTAPAGDSKPDGLIARAKAANEEYQGKVAGFVERSEEKRHGAGEYEISEDGKNGSVRFEPGRMVRKVKKLVGRDDEQAIPIRAITAVSLDRKRVGRDVVKITTSGGEYEWKMNRGEAFKAELDRVMYE